jgi:D-hexose-6-phosphate mutarotase
VVADQIHVEGGDIHSHIFNRGALTIVHQSVVEAQLWTGCGSLNDIDDGDQGNTQRFICVEPCRHMAEIVGSKT